MIKEILYKIFKIEERPCSACEAYKMQIGIANNEKERLLQTILSLTAPKPETIPTIIQPQELKKRAIPWNVQRQMLEAEDRRQAQVLAEQERIQAEIKKLEEEVGIKNDEAISRNAKEGLQPKQYEGQESSAAS